MQAAKSMHKRNQKNNDVTFLLKQKTEKETSQKHRSDAARFALAFGIRFRDHPYHATITADPSIFDRDQDTQKRNRHVFQRNVT
jgi:hypothetical protein